MDLTAPRLHVIPATACNKALVLRRGPTGQVASLIWDRATGSVELGQWLKGRIYEHRSDLSPDGRHMFYFAGTGQTWWTAISRAPWLRAIYFERQNHTWHGGGAFTSDGKVFLNGAGPADDLPDGLSPAPSHAYPHGTDGFHMGGLYPAMMVARGWNVTDGSGYETKLEKPLGRGWCLTLGFTLWEKNRSTISNHYTLRRGDDVMEMTGWEWAEPWKKGLQFAAEGALWQVELTHDGLGERQVIHDFSDMEFEPRKAPYEGISE